MKPHLLLTAISLYIGSGLAAQIIHVPGDQPTIALGIFAAADGDTVLVEEGTYVENINFWGKAITVASRFILDGDPGHIENTIIDGSQPDDPNYGSTVTFESGEDTTSVIMGFTITGGTGTYVPAIPLMAGGGIICNFSGAKITNNIITNNHIDTFYNGEGAGIAVGPPDSYAYTIIRDNMIHDNSISANEIPDAGGIAIRSAGLIEGNEIHNNTVESMNTYANAGGIYCGGWEGHSFVDIKNNYIHHNEAYSSTSEQISGQAGGLMIYKNTGTVCNNVITDNYLEGNTINRGAGMIIAVVDHTLVFSDNHISRNYFENGQCLGGGIFILYATPCFYNNIISENEATTGGGLFVYYIEEDPIQIINNTITGNYAEESSGGMYLEAPNALVMNTIFWDNDAPEDPEIGTWDSDLTVVYSVVEDGWEGEGNIDEDPLFCDDTCHISWLDSPCWDAGTDQYEINGVVCYAPDHDFEGTVRPGDAYVDIGADEDLMGVGVEKLQVAGCRLQVYPNPAVGRSEINYQLAVGSRQLAVSGNVRITLHDITGKYIQTLLSTIQPTGEYTIPLNVTGIPAGIYLIRLQAGDAVATQKLVVLSH